MTTKRTISLTDTQFQFAIEQVESGRYASLSAVVQDGLRLLEQRQEEHQARLQAIREDLARRASQPSIPIEEVDRQLADWRARRDAGEDDELV